MEDRLAELKRQRALVAEHLQWIDQEILRARGAPLPAAAPAPSATTPAPAPVSANTGAPSPTEQPAETSPVAPAGDLPALDRQNIRQDMKRGCLIWAALAFLLVVLVFALMAWFGRQHRPPPKPAVEGSTLVAPERDPAAGFVPRRPDRFG